MESMRILLVTSGYPPEKLGGAGLYVKYLAEELSREHEVHLFISSRRSGSWNEEGVHVHATRPETSLLRAVLIGETYRNPRIEEEFKKLLNEIKPDIVHFHNLWAFRTGFLPKIARDMGYKTVQTLHDYWFICPIGVMSYKKKEPCDGPSPLKCRECWNYLLVKYASSRGVPGPLVSPLLKVFNRPKKFKERLNTLINVLNSIDAIIAPSKFLGSMMEKAGVDRTKIHVIHNGYPYRIFRDFQKDKDTDRLVFGFVGVPSHQKGAHIAVKAVRLLKEDFEFRIYGGGGEKEYLKTLLALINGDERIRLMGRFTDVREPYSKIDVLIFPSLWYENSPLVLAEAALTRTPVVGSNLGAIPEFVHHGKNGFLFTPGDYIDLARWMEKFLENPELVKLLGSNQTPPEDMSVHSRRVLRIYKGI